MKLNKYQKAAITTKIYDDSVAIPYIVLGICGEAAELYEKIVQGEIGEGDIGLLAKEIGDVAWYLAGWAEENSLSLDNVALLKTINSTEGEKSILQLKDELVLYSGQIAEFAKKALRDNFEDISNGIYPSEKMDQTNTAVANLLEVIRGISFFFILDFDQVLNDNLEKLKSRAQRGKLEGSGDVR